MEPDTASMAHIDLNLFLFNKTTKRKSDGIMAIWGSEKPSSSILSKYNVAELHDVFYKMKNFLLFTVQFYIVMYYVCYTYGSR